MGQAGLQIFFFLKNLHIICCEKKIAQPKISLQTHSKFQPSPCQTQTQTHSEFLHLPQCSFSTHTSLYATVASSSSSSLQDNITMLFLSFVGFSTNYPITFALAPTTWTPPTPLFFIIHFSVFTLFILILFNFIFLCFFFS